MDPAPIACSPAGNTAWQPSAEAHEVQNLSLPIHQLPTEVLIDIFSLYTAPPDPHWTLRDRLAVPLMAVCRYWREIIRDTPTFWCNITASPKGLAFMNLSLARSATAPITVDVAYPSEEIVETILLHAHRVRGLYADRLTPNDMVLLEPLFKASMPILADLTLDFYTGNLFTDVPMGTYLRSLSSEAYPHLQSLSMSNIRAHLPDINFYSNLRHLTFRFCSCNQTLDQFLDILALASSSLESLDLHKFLYDPWGKSKPTLPHAPWRPKISLPRMKSLSLEDQPICVTGLLAHLRLPSTIQVHIRCHVCHGWDPDAELNNSFTALLGHSPRSGLLPPLSRTAHLDVCAGAFRYSLRGKSVSANGDAWESDFQYYSDDNLDPRLFSNVLRDVVAVYGASAPLKTLSVIYGNYDTVPLADHWKAIFASFPTLETVTITGGMGSATCLWTGLEAASAAMASADDGSRALACPQLRKIAVSGPKFRASREFFESALECLRFRADAGASLEELDIAVRVPDEHSDVESFEALASEYVPLLQTVVGQVRCVEPPKEEPAWW